MFEHADLSLIDWSRAQFALTAMYHWIFVPLTLGMGFMIAIMETIYVRTGNPEWKRITQFWMKLFGINFAIGIATGLIMEFEFGTNWSNYSWYVGDIFGAPLAIEGIMAFFLESTFIAIMFFGWSKVSKKFHLASTWLTAFGANISALWILVANSWMQYPVGMHFNPVTGRSEMLDFWAVLLSPVAVNKFLHTISSAYVLAALFIMMVSAWFMLKKREIPFAKKSMLVAGIFGLLASLFTAVTGDGSAYMVAQKQPAKLAAMEGLRKGSNGTGLVLFGILNSDKKDLDGDNDDFLFKWEVPKLLSVLAYHNANSFVPGRLDLVEGNKENKIEPTSDKIAKGKIAIRALAAYKKAKKEGNTAVVDSTLNVFQAHYRYMGFGYLKDPASVIPNVPMVFYSFHIMVIFGVFFILLFVVALSLIVKNKIDSKRLLLRIIMWTFPLGFIASQAGWIVAEVGRQPWAIQDLLPTAVSTTNIGSTSVMITFFLFAALFTALLIAEIKIMLTAIKSGPKGGDNV
ncbi:MAG: cytochrome ubiquinol oxidase subunit I [Bacteroidota bacterium]